MDTNRYIIFAPHVDDELIGCYRLLESGSVSEVHYFYDLDSDRIAEAIKAGAKYGFDVFFHDGTTTTIDVGFDTVLVPSSYDTHPHHAAVRRLGESITDDLLYYSVDMNHRYDVLSVLDQHAKKNALYELYPSQAKLFANEKYWMFESTPTRDESLKMIYVTFQKEGIHRYKAALMDPALKDVEFLGYPHRHMFHFKVSIQVFHDDRDIEFILFKRYCESLYNSGTLALDYKSCEMLADDLMRNIRSKYPSRKLVIDISEDGENGCVAEYLL